VIRGATLPYRKLLMAFVFLLLHPSCRDGAPPPDAAPPPDRPDVSEVRDASPRASEEPEPEAAMPFEPACVVPDIAIERSEGCQRSATYPGCRWKVPEPERAGGLYDIWRNTTPDHTWGRPVLVSLVLAVASDHARAHPGERVTVGDLDAPGPRHKTHRGGVDVDLYLPGFMATENLGTGRARENYAGLSPEDARAKRARVVSLAKTLAACTAGRLRVYYNDSEVIAPFEAWFRGRGFRSPFGRPMVAHNPLHLFHFHVTIPADLEVLPGAGVAPRTKAP